MSEAKDLFSSRSGLPQEPSTPHSASGPPIPGITGYVLAGGRSSRMGQDKALLQTNGKPLVEQALQTLQPVCEQVHILSGPPNSDREALLSRYARLVPDEDTTHAGPLAALSAALTDCSTPWVLLLAVDQPDIPTDLLRRLARIGLEASALAACFLSNDRPEPLPLLASCDLRPGVLRALQSGERRLLPTVAACATELERALLLVPPPEAAAGRFVNLNTPGDLRLWRYAASTTDSAGNASETTNG